MAKKAKTRTRKTLGGLMHVEDKSFHARHAFNTLMDAENIKSNKQLMRDVRKHAEETRERARRIARLEDKLI